MATAYESQEDTQRASHDDQDLAREETASEAAMLPPWLLDADASTDLCQSAYCPEMTLTAPDTLWLGQTGHVDVQLRSRQAPGELVPTLGVASSDPFVGALDVDDERVIEGRKQDERWAVMGKAPGRTTIEAELDAPPELLMRRQTELTVPRAEVQWEVEKINHSGTHPGDIHQLMRATSRDGVDTPADELVVRAHVSNFVDSDELVVKHVLSGDILTVFEHEQLPTEANEAAGTMVMGMRFRPRSEAVGSLPMRLGVDLGGQEYHVEHDCSVVMTEDDYTTQLGKARSLVDSSYEHLHNVFGLWGKAFIDAHVQQQRVIEQETTARTLARQREQAAQELVFEVLFTAVLAGVTGGIGGILGTALKKAGNGDVIVDGAKDILKGSLRTMTKELSSTSTRASSRGERRSFGVEPAGEGGPVEAAFFGALSFDNIESMTLDIQHYVGAEKSAVLRQLMALEAAPGTVPLDFDPATAVRDAMVLNDTPLGDLPEPDAASLRSQMELAMWSQWLEYNSVVVEWQVTKMRDVGGRATSITETKSKLRETLLEDGPAAARIRALCDATDSPFEAFINDALDAAYARARAEAADPEVRHSVEHDQ